MAPPGVRSARPCRTPNLERHGGRRRTDRGRCVAWRHSSRRCRPMIAAAELARHQDAALESHFMHEACRRPANRRGSRADRHASSLRVAPWRRLGPLARLPRGRRFVERAALSHTRASASSTGLANGAVGGAGQRALDVGWRGRTAAAVAPPPGGSRVVGLRQSYERGPPPAVRSTSSSEKAARISAGGRRRSSSGVRRAHRRRPARGTRRGWEAIDRRLVGVRLADPVLAEGHRPEGCGCVDGERAANARQDDRDRRDRLVDQPVIGEGRIRRDIVRDLGEGAAGDGDGGVWRAGSTDDVQATSDPSGSGPP